VLWVNVSLYPRPPETSVVCGYVLDSSTNDPVCFCDVYLIWVDGQGHISFDFSTSTDSSGFYSIDVAPGEIYLRIYVDDYNPKRTYRSDVFENETIWRNISLKKVPIMVDIIKPLKALYLFNRRLMPLSDALIIGNIHVEAFVHDYWFSEKKADKVEFYVDGELKATITSKPYRWKWREKTSGTYTIKVIAYDSFGNTATDEITVQKMA
jgi:hypothetical protein